MEVPKSLMTKKIKRTSKIWQILLFAIHEQTVAKCQFVQTSYINKLNCSCLCDMYRTHCVQSVLTTQLGQDSHIQTPCSVNKS